MDITYNDIKKDLPPERLRDLFVSVGWSDGGEICLYCLNIKIWG